MSTQSGITISEELLNEYKNLKPNGSIIIKVSQNLTSLIPDPNYETKNSSVSISTLKQYVSNEYPQPNYSIISKDGKQYFISFIPDSAPIKQKMLYASTKNTILTQLGSNNFIKKLDLTEIDELSLEIPEEDDKVDVSNDDEKLLHSLNNNIENLNLTHGYKKELASMDNTSDLLYKFDPKLIEELKDEENQKLIVFNIDMDKEVINLVESIDNVSIENLVSSLEQKVKKSPLYVLYNYKPTHSCFIYTCPSGSPVKQRMVYASFKNTLVNELKNTYLKGRSLDKNFEVGDLEELNVSELNSANEAKSLNASSGLKFNKPKGPRRR